MCCNFEQTIKREEGHVRITISGSQIEDLVDESDLTEDIFPAHPSNLPLSDHVHRLVTLNRSPRRLELPKSLLGLDPTFDGSVVLLQNIVQVLHGPVPATGAKRPFLLYIGDGRAVVVRKK